MNIINIIITQFLNYVPTLKHPPNNLDRTLNQLYDFEGWDLGASKLCKRVIFSQSRPHQLICILHPPKLCPNLFKLSCFCYTKQLLMKSMLYALSASSLLNVKSMLLQILSAQNFLIVEPRIRNWFSEINSNFTDSFILNSHL